MRIATIRLRFSKLGKVRFTSHRDVARIWERAIRRAAVPVAYTEGFSPHPRLSFGLALPTGHESLAEYLDVDISEPVAAAELPARLDPALPVGFHVQGAVEVEPGTPSLQQAVVSCTWRIEVSEASSPLEGAVATVVAAAELPITRERKGRTVTDDARPSILSMTATGPTTIDAELAAQGRGLRPTELVGLLGAAAGNDLSLRGACRLHQWMVDTDGTRFEPVPRSRREHPDVRPHALRSGTDRTLAIAPT